MEMNNDTEDRNEKGADEDDNDADNDDDDNDADDNGDDNDDSVIYWICCPNYFPLEQVDHNYYKNHTSFDR